MKYLDVLLFVSCLTLFKTSMADNYDGGPPKHKGVFIKQTVEKIIPHSERPGEEMIVFDVENLQSISYEMKNDILYQFPFADWTLWPYQIDTDPIFQEPFVIKGLEGGSALVGINHTVRSFPGVEATLAELSEKGYVLATVSLTNSTDKTMAMLNAFDLTKHFKHMEMAPGPDKLSLITAICTRSGLSMEDVLYFERDPQDVVDMIWKHVIVYCVDEKGLTNECAREGLYVFRLRPREERRKQQTQKKETSNKNKSRPAMEKDGTEISGFDYNATQIEYS